MSHGLAAFVYFRGARLSGSGISTAVREPDRCGTRGRGPGETLEEYFLGRHKPRDVVLVAAHLESEWRLRWKKTPVVDDGQPRDREDVLELRVMLPTRTPPCGGTLKGRVAAFDFDGAFSVRGKAVETRALPRPNQALHAHRLDGEADLETVTRPGLPFEGSTARATEGSGAFLRWMLLFEEQACHGLGGTRSENRRGVR